MENKNHCRHHQDRTSKSASCISPPGQPFSPVHGRLHGEPFREWTRWCSRRDLFSRRVRPGKCGHVRANGRRFLHLRGR
ncbi:hypothetical protein [Klebsiella phage vB_KshKPC-M]|nr:hypothetical protein [Klebsiella phage vB_KshKPC-M]